ncbi:MAG: hypothetical protein U0457_14550 [Candidatus Sericytochromatia bacterium]
MKKVILIVLFSIFLLNKSVFATQQRAKVASVKSNMHTFQTIVETYSVDYEGLYPKNVEDLKKAAEKSPNKYWKDFKSPFTGKTGKGQSYDNFDKTILLNDDSWYSYFFPKKYPAGMVYYDPVIDGKNITKYYIYGSEKNGKLIKDTGGNPLTLSNN